MTTARERATARIMFLLFSIIRSGETSKRVDAPAEAGRRSACSRLTSAMEHKPRNTRAAITRYGDCPIRARRLAYLMERYRAVRKELCKI